MKKYSKWIGGGLGWVVAGPLGAILGFLIGDAIGKSSEMNSNNSGATTTRGDFMVSLVVLTAAVMKADERVTKGELNYVKQFFARSFSEEVATDGIRMLRDVLKQNIPIQDVSRQIGQMLNYSGKTQIIHYLFGISNADGNIHPNEINVIKTIAINLGLSNSDFDSIKSMFVNDATSAYKILGISPSATDDEVKKAYRKMAVENHPDKVAYLGEDVQKAAKEKFQQINDAYESIKKERGMV